MSGDIEKAQQEVHNTLSLCNFCTSKIAISFIDELPIKFVEKVKVKCWYILSLCGLAGLVGGEFAFVASSSSVVGFAASLHIVGYGSMSLAKCLMLWFKAPVFRKVVKDLADLWPVSITDPDSVDLKHRSLTALRFGQLCYMFFNIMGVCFYNITPLVLYLFRRLSSGASDLGYVWHVNYPFDKTQPVWHELAYIFECFAGTVSVWSQLGSDLLFTTMASHISMLLRLLQVRIRNIGDLAARKMNAVCTRDESNRVKDSCTHVYEEIVSVIKVHQRLISYSKELEDVFAIVNLTNVLLSSVNICCVVFNIALLEPWMDVSNKLFLGAALQQVGIMCWYADEIFQASVGVADAVYESSWYNTEPRCRRGLLLLLQRSQKPLCFTALKFRNITMNTYTSIITTSYSYFTLLYAMYSE